MRRSIRRTFPSIGCKYLLGSVALSSGVTTCVRADAILRRIRNAIRSIHRPVLVVSGEGVGIEAGSQASEEHLLRMLGMVQDCPVETQLGRPPRACKAPYAKWVSTHRPPRWPDSRGTDGDAVVFKIEARNAQPRRRSLMPSPDSTSPSGAPSISIVGARRPENSGVDPWAHQEALAYVVGTPSSVCSASLASRPYA